MNRTRYKKIFYLMFFAISMAYLEAAVVVYLREIFYPGGFSFPLTVISPKILAIEQFREIATIIMLITTAWFAGKNFYKRLAYFLCIFAIWDIFYYIFLKLILNWPPSIFTWDILFLIPITWIGPVLAPVICSITMIFMALLIVYLQENAPDLKIKKTEWILIFTGIFCVFTTFIYDFTKIIITGGFFTGLAGITTDIAFNNAVAQFIPVKYNWHIFILGELLIFYSMVLFYKRIKLKNSK